MNARSGFRLAWLLMLVVAITGRAVADEASEATAPERLVYVPPDLGAPPTRTLAAVRGIGGQSLQVLAPKQTGLTLEEQPVLYWYLGAPSDARLEVTMLEETGGEPLIEYDLGPVKEPGVHALDLAEFGVRLKPGVEYQWSVAQVVDPEQRSADRVASATIERTAPDADLRARFEGATPMERLAALAAQGYWYDVIGLLSREIEERPGDAGLRDLRADLLEQVGLERVAAYDRAAAKDQ